MAAGVNLTIIVIAGNEEKMIGDCLKSASFAKEIILSTNSTDKTVEIAKKIIPHVAVYRDPISSRPFNFSQARNRAFKKAHSGWVMYLDADERIPVSLRREIIKTTKGTPGLFTNFDIPRANYFLGKRVKYGGTYPDYVKRLFWKNNFSGYTGAVHEQPSVSGPGSALQNDLLHLTHRDLTSMLEKTIKWTEIEAKMLFDSNHPLVVWWRFPRMMFTKFWQRFIKEQMWKDGMVGLVSVIFEVFDTFIIYARLWEIQQNQN